VNIDEEMLMDAAADALAAQLFLCRRAMAGLETKAELSHQMIDRCPPVRKGKIFLQHFRVDASFT
jgi:hypothetical protein